MSLPVDRNNARIQAFGLKEIRAITPGVLNVEHIGAIVFSADQPITMNGVTATWPKNIPLGFSPGVEEVTLLAACNAFIM